MSLLPVGDVGGDLLKGHIFPGSLPLRLTRQELEYTVPRRGIFSRRVICDGRGARDSGRETVEESIKVSAPELESKGVKGTLCPSSGNPPRQDTEIVRSS